MATIRIEDLKISTILGVGPGERMRQQMVVINLSFDYDATRAILTDDIEAALDYKALKKKILLQAAKSKFYLLEKLTDFVLQIVMEEPRVMRATVRIDKPQALRYAKSVSVELAAVRGK
jgi:D-erythro-7,8-dihydroneopterin triphosphate epimerase